MAKPSGSLSEVSGRPGMYTKAPKSRFLSCSSFCRSRMPCQMVPIENTSAFQLYFPWNTSGARKEVTVGMSSFGNRLSDSQLKAITRKMIVYNYNLRPSAEEVHIIMTQIENDVLSLSRPQQLSITSGAQPHVNVWQPLLK